MRGLANPHRSILPKSVQFTDKQFPPSRKDLTPSILKMSYRSDRLHPTKTPVARIETVATLSTEVECVARICDLPEMLSPPRVTERPQLRVSENKSPRASRGMSNGPRLALPPWSPLLELLGDGSRVSTVLTRVVL